jgi:hypothetical protein
MAIKIWDVRIMKEDPAYCTVQQRTGDPEIPMPFLAAIIELIYFLN